MTLSIKFLIILTLSFLVACDCQYEISGIVLDARTQTPISNVAIGKTDSVNLDNPFNRKTYTNDQGVFDIHGIAGFCNEVTMYFSNEEYETRKITFENYSKDTVYLERKKNYKIDFNPNSDFSIRNILSSNDYPSSLPDKNVCKNWDLTELEIKTILRSVEPISGPDWHHLFEHLPCQIIGKIEQNNQEFTFAINSGAWLTINSFDTTLIFGSFKEENNHYFLSNAWMEDIKKDKE